jgi:hypothetical protein
VLLATPNLVPGYAFKFRQHLKIPLVACVFARPHLNHLDSCSILAFTLSTIIHAPIVNTLAILTGGGLGGRAAVGYFMLLIVS